MIKVTRLNNSQLWVNAELIEFIEATPDTIISMTSHTKIVVKESPEQLVDAVTHYRRRIHSQRPQVFDRSIHDDSDPADASDADVSQEG